MKFIKMNAWIIIAEEAMLSKKSKSVEIVRNPDGSLSFPNGLVLNEWKAYKANSSSISMGKFMRTMAAKWYGVDKLGGEGSSLNNDKISVALNKAIYAFKKLLNQCKANGGKCISAKILFTLPPLQSYTGEYVNPGQGRGRGTGVDDPKDFLRKDGKGLLKRKRRKRKEEEEIRRQKRLQKIKEEEMSESDIELSDDDQETKPWTRTYGAFEFPTDKSLRSSFTIFGHITKFESVKSYSFLETLFMFRNSLQNMEAIFASSNSLLDFNR